MIMLHFGNDYMIALMCLMWLVRYTGSVTFGGWSVRLMSVLREVILRG